MNESLIIPMRNDSKIIQIRSININGLANIDTVWKLFHYFIATRTDIKCIQEIKRLTTL